MEKKLLESIKLPQGVKNLDKQQLEQLCFELREEILDKVSVTGGHLASNLGAVELTVALHYVFDSPREPIVWDVGHQCYSHKLLTGRDITGIRTEGGVSGFPKPCESEHDAFVAGHASTSISAALGIAEAKKLCGDNSSVVAVVGDGAASGGMIYEAINNAGRSQTNLIVVLNDNEMSISKNVGAMAKYLAKIRNKEGYFHFKDAVQRFLLKIPLVGKGIFGVAKYCKTALKDFYYGSNTFEHFGFTYLGPVDGHDISMLIRVLKRAQSLKCPVLVHVNTVKGRGYRPAEKLPSKFHGIAPFDRTSGELTEAHKKSFSDTFGESVFRLAASDKTICAITAAMTDGTGLKEFAQKYPERFFDVGIAEEHAVTFAAGLAAGGMKPVFAVYSTFLQRSFDQIIHDASINPLHIVLAVDRAGIVGGDGETHQGIFDIPMLTAIPGVTIYSPFNYAELEKNLKTAFAADGVQVVRYPKDCEKTVSEEYSAEYGDYDFFENRNDCLIITYGRLFAEAGFAAKKTDASVLKLDKIFPIDETVVKRAAQFKNIFFFEESVQNGSIAEHFGTLLRKYEFCGKYIMQCVSGFVPHMKVSSAMKKYGLNSDSMVSLIEKEALK